MKKLVLFILVILFFCSCKNLLFNTALRNLGAYDDKIYLQKFISDSKEVVIFPMVHVAVEAQYDDVKKKIDSLNALGYYFYYEEVKMQHSDTVTVLRKFRKITKRPIPAKGHKFVIDSVIAKKFNVKLKKQIVNQPSYLEFGVDSTNGRNADVKIGDLVDFYEKNYKIITLEPCDLNTSIYKESGCKDDKDYPEMRQEIVLDYRNKHVLEELRHEKRNKIAIIYGKGHLKGIKEGLIKMGYKEK